MSDRSFDRRDFLVGSAAATAATGLWLGGCATAGPVSATAGTTIPLPDYFEKNFGVGHELIRQVMAAALAHGGDWADLYFQHRQIIDVGLEDDVVNRAATSVDLGVGIRVVVGDQTGYAYTESLGPKSMVAAAKTAAGVAKAAASAPPQNLTPASLPSYYPVTDWGAVDVGRVIPILDQINSATRAKDGRVERVKVGFSAAQSIIMVVDSSGRTSFDSQPMTRLYLSLVMEDKGERQTNGWNIAARDGIDFYAPQRLDRLVNTAYDRTKILFAAKTAPGGEMPVVLAAGSSGILLHEAIGHGMEADFNRKGRSIFSDRINKKVAEPFVSIVDSGVHPKQRGAINVDDEGNASKTTYLVEKGILKSYMHDRISARHYRVEPTGSGRRQSFRHMPQPRMRSTYMLDGPHHREEIFKAAKNGIYALSFTNGQVDIGGGDYSFYIKNGFLIEDGKLTAPIKDVNVIGNGPQTLERITMVAADFAMDEGGWTCGKGGQSVPVSLGLPTVLVSKIVVGGAA